MSKHGTLTPHEFNFAEMLTEC